jgi:hypothetical protein
LGESEEFSDLDDDDYYGEQVDDAGGENQDLTPILGQKPQFTKPL